MLPNYSVFEGSIYRSTFSSTVSFNHYHVIKDAVKEHGKFVKILDYMEEMCDICDEEYAIAEFELLSESLWMCKYCINGKKSSVLTSNLGNIIVCKFIENGDAPIVIEIWLSTKIFHIKEKLCKINKIYDFVHAENENYEECILCDHYDTKSKCDHSCFCRQDVLKFTYKLVTQYYLLLIYLLNHEDVASKIVNLWYTECENIKYSARPFALKPFNPIMPLYSSHTSWPLITPPFPVTIFGSGISSNK